MILCASCQDKQEKKEFYRADTLLRYINDKTDFDRSSEYLIVLVNATDCGACNIKSIEHMQQHPLYDKKINRYFLITEEKTDLLKGVIDPNAKILYSDVTILEKYGLRLFTTYLFHIKDGKIVNWKKFE